MGDLYRAMVEAAAERAADNEGIVDLVSVAEAAGLGFDADTFASDVTALHEERLADASINVSE